jgi:hypothetical protein
MVSSLCFHIQLVPLRLGGQNAILAAELQVREDAALSKLLLILRKQALEETLGADEGVKTGEV